MEVLKIYKKEYNKNIKLFDNKTKYFYGNKQKKRMFPFSFFNRHDISILNSLQAIVHH